MNNLDPRFGKCAPFDTTSVEIQSPRVAKAKDAADVSNAAVLASAIDPGVDAMNHCSAPLSLVVPTRGTKPGKRVVKVKTHTTTGVGRAKLRLICAAAGS